MARNRHITGSERMNREGVCNDFQWLLSYTCGYASSQVDVSRIYEGG